MDDEFFGFLLEIRGDEGVLSLFEEVLCEDFSFLDFFLLIDGELEESWGEGKLSDSFKREVPMTPKKPCARAATMEILFLSNLFMLSVLKQLNANDSAV